LNIPDFYGALGVPPEATLEQIEAGWREQLKSWHPDRFNNAPAEKQAEAKKRTMLINQARDVLTDPVRKQRYDDALKAAKNAGMGGSGAGNFSELIKQALAWFATAPFAVKIPDDEGNESDGGMSPIQALCNLNSNLERLNAGLYGYVDSEGEQVGLVQALMDLTEAIDGEDNLTDQISANTETAEEALGKVGKKKRRKKT
jgi:curved DNA-binding protein CbpA